MLSVLTKHTFLIIFIAVFLCSFIAGVLIGYFFFEKSIVDRINNNLEKANLGLCDKPKDIIGYPVIMPNTTNGFIIRGLDGK